MKTVAQRSSKLTSSALESCGTLATLSRFAAAFFSACLVFPSPWPPCEASLYETRYLTLFRLPAAKDGNVKCKWYALIALKIPPYAKVFVSEYLMESSLMNFISESRGTMIDLSFIIFNWDCLTALFKILPHRKEWGFLLLVLYSRWQCRFHCLGFSSMKCIFVCGLILFVDGECSILKIQTVRLLFQGIE